MKLCSGTECVVSMSEARGTDWCIALEVFSMNFGVSNGDRRKGIEIMRRMVIAGLRGTQTDQ